MAEILVTAQIGPDLDGLACLYAYSRLLKRQGFDVVGGVFGDPHVEGRYLIERFGISNLSYSPPEPFKKFILVDASDLAGMPKIIRAEDVIEVIDHRNIYEPAKTFPKAHVQIDLVGAAATLIVERYRQANLGIDSQSSRLLYGAIFSNTLNLKARVTKDRDLEAVEFLRTQAEMPEDLVRKMFEAKSLDVSQNLDEQIGQEAKTFVLGQKKFSIVQIEVLGAKELVKNNLDLILKKLNGDQKSYGYDFMFLNAVDLEGGFNLFVTANPSTQEILRRAFEVKFEGGVALREGLILRKEMVPLINSYLGK